MSSKDEITIRIIENIIEKRPKGRPRFIDTLKHSEGVKQEQPRERKPLTEEQLKENRKIRNKEYYEAHKELYRERFKAAYAIVKEERLRLLKAGLLPEKPEVVCECGSKIYKENLHIHEKSKKHQKFIESVEK